MIDNPTAAAEFHRGDQVVYIPHHATPGDTTHEDCEFGFVTSVKGSVVFVRYFFRQKFLPARDRGQLILRTIQCSEATMPSTLTKYNFTSQVMINNLLASLES